MTREQLTEQIFLKKSFLCIGLDTDLQRVPKHLQNGRDAIFNFNKAIIDATKDLCVSYKINTAFYEAMGVRGWEALEQTVNYIPGSHLKIADAKRGDIGNTSSQYARAFFETLDFDALTVSPYMGEDSVRPFLEYRNKWTILLGLTSNEGARNFEKQRLLLSSESLDEGVHVVRHATPFLYEHVMESAMKWGTTDNLMFVVGATQATAFADLRKIAPDHFFLVPGVGAQGGTLADIAGSALTKGCGLLVNASRAVIYASEGEDFAVEAAAIARQYQYEMGNFLERL